MRHFRNRRAIAEAIGEMFNQHGARVIDEDGMRFALFFDDFHQSAVAKVSVDALAASTAKAL